MNKFYIAKYNDKMYFPHIEGTPYTRKEYYEAGSYTLVIPPDITEVYVTGCGGGAGGLTMATYHKEYDGYQTSSNANLSAGDGQDSIVSSSLGSVVIEGGKGANAEFVSGVPNIINIPEASQPNGIQGVGRIMRNVDYSLQGQGFRFGSRPMVAYADIAGIIGYYQYASGGTTVDFIDNGGTTKDLGVFGAGGWTYHYYDSDGYADQIGITGNSGAFIQREKLLVVPNTTLNITVGYGGSYAYFSTDWDEYRYRVTDGSDGFIIIEFGVGSKHIFTALFEESGE